jgi:NhaP-type Na+/H+ or K+/H+ antiporter
LELSPVLVFIGLLVFLSHLFVSLFEKTKVPDVLYLILIGVLVGPVLHIVSPQDFGRVGHVFTTIALVVILFDGGLELSFEHLRDSLRSTLLITIVSYAITFGIVASITVGMMQISLPLALFVAAVIAAPAPAVIIPLVRQFSLTASARTALTLESPLGEALGIVVALGILESVRYESVNVGLLIGRLLSSFVFALLIGGVGGFAWSVLLHRVRQLRYAIFTTPAFLLVLFGITEFLGFSGPVSALTFGITLANAGTNEIPLLKRKYNLTPLEHNETERAFFGEIGFLIKTFFFVYLGLSTTLSDASTILLALLITGGLVLARMTAVRLSTRRTATQRRDAVLMSMMVPRGTAAAVLAALPLQLAMPGGELIQNVIYSVILVSIVLTAVLLFLVERTPFVSIVGIFFGGYRTDDGGADRAGNPPNTD